MLGMGMTPRGVWSTLRTPGTTQPHHDLGRHLFWPATPGITVIQLNLSRDRDHNVPGSADTWTVSSYPAWWHAGDRVTGSRTLSLTSVCDVGMYLRLSNNSLSGAGYVHQYLTINGVS